MLAPDVDFDVVVVGGGPAGCGAALELLRRRRRVLVLERDAGAPDRLCGEFLSPDGVGSLVRWGAIGALPVAPVIRSFSLATPSSTIERPLPGPALGIARRVLDPALRSLVRERGGDVREGVRVTSVESRGDAFLVRTAAGEVTGSHVVGAVGRAARVPGLTEGGTKNAPDRSEYVAMKAHFECEAPGDVVSLYTLGGAYVGVSAVGPSTVNVCFLARRDAFDAGGRSPDGLLSRASHPRWQELRARLVRATPWVSVAAMSFRARRPAFGPHLLVGDAAALVSPFLGEGLSMALESGRLAGTALDQARSGMDRVEVAARYAASWRRSFRGRLVVGEWAQRILLSHRAAEATARILARFPVWADVLVARTRSRELMKDASELLARPAVEVR